VSEQIPFTPTRVAPSPTGRFVAAAAGFPAVVVLDLVSRRERKLPIPLGRFVADLTWSPCGRRLAMSGHNILSVLEARS
jgi:hypothetical protein